MQHICTMRKFLLNRPNGEVYKQKAIGNTQTLEYRRLKGELIMLGTLV